MAGRRLERLGYAVALLAAVAPLWAARNLPMVDLPQHLHLISVLHRLNDPTTLYPQLFTTRAELTTISYLGYYYAVHWLNWLVPELLANRIFMTAYVAGMALGMAFLLRALRRPTWPSLLALPFAYGDSFGWGFINYCASLPLVFLTLGLFVLAVEDARRRQRWAIGLAVSLAAVMLFHVQSFAYLGVALPLLLMMTRAPEDASHARLMERLRVRRAALIALLPGVALFLAWAVGGVGGPKEIAPGQPWKAWGPMLSAQNLQFKTFAQNLAEMTQMPANLLRDGSDRYALVFAVAIAIASVLSVALPGARGLKEEGPIARWRLPVLSLAALALFFTLPFDIRGYMYYLNTRYLHLAGPLLLACGPPLAGRARTALSALAVAASIALGVPLSKGFADFDQESRALDRIAEAAPPKPKVMGLIFDTSSRFVNHPVYLHSAAVIARERGGATNFSFALTPHSPLKYRGEPPPTFPSEWRPDQFDYAQQGAAYDTFVVRWPRASALPDRPFAGHLGNDLKAVAHEDAFWLVHR